MIRISSIALKLMCTVLSLIASQIFSPSDSNIIYEGRASFQNEEYIEYNWSGFSILFTVQVENSNELTLHFNDDSNWFNVRVNGELFPMIKTVSGTEKYTISNLPLGTCEIVVSKRFETYWSATGKFLGIETSDQLVLPQRKKNRIEFIGDSYVAGYGVESPNRDGDPDEYGSVNPYTFYTNTDKSFGRLVSNEYNAEAMITAYSGKGLVRNAGGADEGDWFLPYYSQAIASSNNGGSNEVLWDFDRWRADLVVIHLGINDFSGEDVPPADTIIWNKKYHELIDSVRSNYNDVKIILMATQVWPHYLLRDQVQKVVTEERQNGYPETYYYDYSIDATGLDWHPNESEHREIADGLIDLIKENSIIEKISTQIHSLSTFDSGFLIGNADNQIQISVPISGRHTISIQRLNGRVVREMSIDLDNVTHHRISTENLASGMYVISLDGASGLYNSKINILE